MAYVENPRTREVMDLVYHALSENGYLLSNDTVYITNHNNAKSMIRKVDRDEFLDELLQMYFYNRGKTTYKNNTKVRETLYSVYDILAELKYNDPTFPMWDYLQSGDPGAVTGRNNARSKIEEVERDEILEELLKMYFSKTV